MSRRRIVAICILSAGLLLLWPWWKLGEPMSVAEAMRNSRLLDAARDKVAALDLEQLAPEGWQIVCNSHGYSGPQKINGRMYPAIGYADDGTWGLIFVYPDGSYYGVRGSCRVPGFSIDLGKCLGKADARVYRTSHRDSCPIYRDTPG